MFFLKRNSQRYSLQTDSQYTILQGVIYYTLNAWSRVKQLVLFPRESEPITVLVLLRESLGNITISIITNERDDFPPTFRIQFLLITCNLALAEIGKIMLSDC